MLHTYMDSRLSDIGVRWSASGSQASCRAVYRNYNLEQGGGLPVITHYEYTCQCRLDISVKHEVADYVPRLS